MSNRKVNYLAVIIFIGIILKVFVPVTFARESGQHEELEVIQQVQAIRPLSIEMVDQTIADLSDGWSGLSADEKEAFLTIYDPANSGEIDGQFVLSVLSNYKSIRHALENDVQVKYEPDSDHCNGKRLYYTDIIRLYVCPYFLIETNDTRKARTLIHEFAHIALRVKDRPYYRPTSKLYAEMTPRGPWMSQLPIVGAVIREIVASDTLYHPDAYAHFALVASGQASAREMFLNYGIGDMNDSYNEDLEGDRATIQTVDSWSVAQ
jgi:hypothetical protein